MRSGCSRWRPTTAGAPGRPQHRYSLAADAPSLGLEPPTFPMLARMLVGVAARVGRRRRRRRRRRTRAGRGRGDRARRPRRPGLRRRRWSRLLDRLGFDPEPVDDERRATTVAFTRCPFRELAEANPELVCGLHRGLIEGFVAAAGVGRGHRLRLPRRPPSVPGAARGPIPGSIGAVITSPTPPPARSATSSRPKASRTWRSGSPCAPVGARASPTRCSSTPTSPTTTSPSTTAG